MTTKQIKPIEPSDFAPPSDAEIEEAIQDVIEYINKCLILERAELVFGAEVEIWDKSGDPRWRVWHKQAIARFIEVGWQVRDTQREGHYMFGIRR